MEGYIKISREEFDEKLKELHSFPKLGDHSTLENDLTFKNIDFSYWKFDSSYLHLLDFCTFIHCNFARSEWRGCKLYRTEFFDCNFFGANFLDSKISVCKLRKCSFTNSYFNYTNILASDLSYSTFLSAAFLDGILDSNILISTSFYSFFSDDMYFLNNHNIEDAKGLDTIHSVCPETGGFIGWKRCQNNRVVKLYIPASAKRSSNIGRKCRCNKAFVLEIYDITTNKKCNIAQSIYDPNFKYKKFRMIKSKEFCENKWESCAQGIHFFMEKREAMEYIS